MLLFPVLTVDSWGTKIYSVITEGVFYSESVLTYLLLAIYLLGKQCYKILNVYEKSVWPKQELEKHHFA